MGKRVILVCEEKGYPDAGIDKIAEMNKSEPLDDVSILKVIDHPPMQWCEHGGADKEADEHALDEANRKKRESWFDHKKQSYGEEISAISGRLKGEGVKNIRVKFLEKEIGFSHSVINEFRDGFYDVAIMSEKTWDSIDGKKVPSEIKVVTV
ncbi:MAG: hypothetical protein OEV42_15485 [Deltaproteobacteria bacterium]|nr:hypothetical protein [Deltaproteobacteria bacterium]